MTAPRLSAEGGDHAEAGDEDDLGPVVERGLAALGVSPVVGLVLGTGGGEHGADGGRDSSLSLRSDRGARMTGSRPARRRCSGVAMPRRTSSGISLPSSARTSSSESSKWRTTRSVRPSAPRITGQHAARQADAARRGAAPGATRPGLTGRSARLTGDQLVHPPGDLDQRGRSIPRRHRPQTTSP